MNSIIRNLFILLLITISIGCSTTPKRPEVENVLLEKIKSKTIDSGYSRVRICSGNTVIGFLSFLKIPTVKIYIDGKDISHNLTTLNDDEQVVLDFRFNERIHITSNGRGSISTTLIPRIGEEQFLTFDSVISRPNSKNKEHDLLAANSGVGDYVSIIQFEIEKNKLDDSRCLGKKINFYKVID